MNYNVGTNQKYKLSKLNNSILRLIKEQLKNFICVEGESIR